MDALQVVLGGVVASVAWFIAGGALYMNPFVTGVYKNAEASSALKKWPSVPRYIALQYIGILAQCLLWAFVFALVNSALPEGLLIRGLVFGFILVVVKIFPRFYDMWIQSTYPGRLLAIELVNGTIGSLIIGMVFAYTIP